MEQYQVCKIPNDVDCESNTVQRSVNDRPISCQKTDDELPPSCLDDES